MNDDGSNRGRMGGRDLGGGPGGRRFGGGRFGGGFEERGGRRRRLFNGGELQLLLTKLIAQTPRHGYDLIRGIEQMTGGAYAPSPGIVYPTLTLLAEMGLVSEQASDGARKLFTITPEGTAQLEAKADEIEAILARLSALSAQQERTDVAPVRRAIHNLRNVLQHKLASGLATEQLDTAIALIDEAARKIERL